MWGRKQPRIGLFGKLPSHPDFISVNAGGPLPRALDSWMQEGLAQVRQTVGNGWEAQFDAAAPLFFAFRNGNASEALVGVCRPGCDRGGRRYPFSVFAEASIGRGGRGFHLLGPGYSRFLRAARRMAVVECAAGIDPAGVTRILNLAGTLPQNVVEMERSFDPYFRDVTMESLWRGVFGDFADPRKYLVIRNLFGALAPLRGHEPARLKMTLRLPVGTGGESAGSVAAIWFLLCRVVLGDDGLAQATMFWHEEQADTGQGSCFLFFRPPQATQLPPLFFPGLKAESLWDIERMGKEGADAARAALGGPIADALDTPGRRVADFLKQM